MTFLRRSWVIGFVLLATACCALAHEPGLSSAEVAISATNITVNLTLNPTDWAAAQVTSPQDIKMDCVELSLNGAPILPISATGPTRNDQHDMACTLTYRNPGAGTLDVHCLLFGRLPAGHREFVKITDASGRILSEQMLSAGSDGCEIEIGPGTTAQTQHGNSGTFASFLLLGINHILTGYDHLLFLSGLLLVCTGFRQAALVITFFTVAHSITLALSVLNIFSLPGWIVEPSIAASIVFVGVENIARPRDFRIRGIITFCFGLIHGLGFASALRGLDIASGHSGILVPLILFNAGVEIGQLTVALPLLPVILFLRKKPQFLRFGIPALSAVVALLGALWFLERTVLPGLSFLRLS